MLQMQRDRQALRALPRLAPEAGRHVPRPEGPGRALHALLGNQAGQRDGHPAGRGPREAVVRVSVQARLATDTRHGLQNEGQRQVRFRSRALPFFSICAILYTTCTGYGGAKHQIVWRTWRLHFILEHVGNVGGNEA